MFEIRGISSRVDGSVSREWARQINNDSEYQCVPHRAVVDNRMRDLAWTFLTHDDVVNVNAADMIAHGQYRERYAGSFLVTFVDGSTLDVEVFAI